MISNPMKVKKGSIGDDNFLFNSIRLLRTFLFQAFENLTTMIYIWFCTIIFNIFSRRYFGLLADSDSPEADRYAPRPDDSPVVYTITEARLKEIRAKFMYWYFDKGGDDDNGDYQTALQATTLQIHKNLNFQLPFFGFRFNYTRVRDLVLTHHIYTYIYNCFVFITHLPVTP